MENGKKISIYFYYFFQWLEMKKKKGNEKKNGVQNRLGYCPIVLQRGRILCCNTVIVLQRFRLGRLKIVLQYSHYIAEKKA